jgi:hypothetical protein
MIAMIMMVAVGSVFTSCSNDDHLLIEDTSQEGKLPSTKDSLSVVTRGTYGTYIYPTWNASGLGDENTYYIPSNATYVRVMATKNTTSVTQPVIKYSWDGGYDDATDVIHLNSSPGVATQKVFYRINGEIESSTLYLTQIYEGENIGAIESIVTVSYGY